MEAEDLVVADVGVVATMDVAITGECGEISRCFAEHNLRSPYPEL